MWAYSVNLQALDTLTGRIGDATRRIDRILEDLDARIAALQSSWHGDAATAHLHAHDQWVCSAVELRRALTELQSAAGRSHRNYTAAMDAGRAMWGATG